MTKSTPKLDKAAFSIVDLDDQDELDREYWRARTPYERLEALEITRQILYGYNPATARLQRFFEVAELK